MWHLEAKRGIRDKDLPERFLVLNRNAKILLQKIFDTSQEGGVINHC
jgi:hypothetical protein